MAPNCRVSYAVDSTSNTAPYLRELRTLRCVLNHQDDQLGTRHLGRKPAVDAHPLPINPTTAVRTHTHTHTPRSVATTAEHLSAIRWYDMGW